MKFRRFLVIASLAALAVSALLFGPPGATADTTIVVRPSDTQGWSTADTRPGGAVNYVTDATAPGGGSGALQLTTNATTAAKAQYIHAANTPLANVTNLSYYTKQVSGPPHADPSYQLLLCLNGVGATPTLADPCGGAGFTTMVFEPYQNNGLAPPSPLIIPNTWQLWDVDAGQLWSSRTYSDGGSCSVVNGAGGPPFYSLAGLKAACPSAVAIGFGVNIGTFNPGYNVYTDLVRFNDTVYNFEATGPNTLLVDDDQVQCPTAAYTSISAAVAAALPGDTIQVCAGTYNENVDIPASLSGLTLNGAQAGNPVAGRSFGSPLESTINGQVTIRPINVKFDGFSLTRSVPTSAAFGIFVAPGADGATITNTIIDTVFSPDTSGSGTAQAIYLSNDSGGDGADNVSITDNRINNIHSNRSSKGVLLGVNGGTNPSQNTLIEGNTMTNIVSDARGAYGVSVANTPNVSGLVIQNNTFDNLIGGGWVHAIGLEGDTPSAIVEDNSISNITDLTPNDDAVAVHFENNPSLATVEVHDNDFNVSTVAFGIKLHASQTGGPVDGTCNFWGNASGPGPVGPGIGARVSPGVNFSSWQTVPDGPCSGPDADNDGVTDANDNCPSIANPDQSNFDGDMLGDACDADDDNDGQSDVDEIACGSNPLNAASKSPDNDGDNSPDCVDADDDNDGILDGPDNCDFTFNPDQTDTDGDGLGNACDGDDDNDGVLDGADMCPGTPPGTVVNPSGCPLAVNKDQCKNGGWMNLRRANNTTFKNQGDCVSYTNNGK